MSTGAFELPLARYELLRSNDVDQAMAVVEAAFCPHRLIPCAAGVDIRFHGVVSGSVGLHYLDYGHDVRILPADLAGCYLIHIPLAGSTAGVRSKSAEVVCSVAVGSVLGPGGRFDIRWPSGNRHLIVKIDRRAVEQHLHKTLGMPLRGPLSFDLGMDMTDPSIRSWKSIVHLLRNEVDNGGSIVTQPLAMRDLERLLLSQLLLAQPNTYSAALHAPPQRLVPRTVRLAAELIEAHAAEPLTVEDVAEAVNVSARALQEGFRSVFQTTPTGYLREVRLRKVQADLVAADPNSVTVTDVAIRWGFVHLGRFSVQYRKRFGESPSQTLRR